mmetsp:Transcript_2492/g.5277  ORF Transcript_2492/g.5277 Transcript_2492/m.5277 type:complete len:338 (-) Transcript_2492:121-1134(-)
MKNFIFGYGSLICPQSRAITAPTLQDAIAEPVVIRHIERTWSARARFTKKQSRSKTSNDSNKPPSTSNDRHHIRGWTPMGVRFRRGAKCNGVLIFVDEEELARFDVREGGYARQRIDLADIHRHVDSEILINKSMSLWPTNSAEVDDEAGSAQSSLFSDSEQLELEHVRCSECRQVFEKASEKRGQTCSTSNKCDSSREREEMAVWVYVQSKNLPAERSFPIPQSYVDIIIRGCLSISHDFARRFLETTFGWSNGGPLKQNYHETCNEQSMEGATQTDFVNSKEPSSIEKHHTWVNDRHDPLYVRADSEYSSEKGHEIDALIKEHHPDALQRRVLSM